MSDADSVAERAHFLQADWVAWPVGDDSKGPDEAPWIQKKVGF